MNRRGFFSALGLLATGCIPWPGVDKHESHKATPQTYVTMICDNEMVSEWYCDGKLMRRTKLPILGGKTP